MTEADAFLADILENPADDAPRLIFADWLEDHDQSQRAEFIRVQIELATLPPLIHAAWVDGYCSVCGEEETPSSHYHCLECGEECGMMGCGKEVCRERGKRRCYLENREKALEAMPYAQWREHCLILYHGGREPTWSWDCRRGFPHAVSCNLQAWLDHGPALVRQHPLECVTLADCSCRAVPESTPRDLRPGWYWREKHEDYDDLPGCLWHRLDPVERDGNWCWYDSTEDANADLSRVCLEWAREQKP